MNLGSLFSGFGRKVGGAAKTGWNKLGELRDEMQDGQSSPTFRQPQRFPMTPGFNPNAPSPLPRARNAGTMFGDGVATIEHEGSGGYDIVFPDGGIGSTMEGRRPQPGAQQRSIDSLMRQRGGQSMPQRPQLERLTSPEQTMPQPEPRLPFGGAGHPPLTDFDPERNLIQPIRESVNITDTIRPGMVSAPNVPPLGNAAERIVPPMPRRGPAPTPMMPDLTAPQMSAPRDASFDSRQDVPIPGRPNRGGPVPYSDYEAGKYDAWANHAKRDEAGNFDPKGGTKRNWKSILQNSLLGAAQNSEGGDIGRIIGGAIGGAGGSAINPQAGYENVWDAGHGRQMMQGQARRDTELDRQRKQRMGDLQIENIESQIGSRQSQAETARINAQRQQAVAESTIKYNQARAEAQQRGTPKAVDLYNEKTGQIESVNVYPDGRREVLGVSGGAMIRRDTLKAQTDRDAANRASRESEGALNRQSREGIAQMPARPRAGGASRTGDGEGIPAEARQEYGRVQRLKQEADALWTRAKAAPEETRAALEEQARAALADANANLQDFGQAYGQYYNVGKGANDWWYAKPKVSEGGSNQSAQTSVSRAAVEAFAKEKGISPEEAAQKFAAKGIQVR